MRKSPNTVRRRLVPAFFLSGLSALIYQVVWQRLLTTHYGVGPISTAIIVTVYMVGLGLGALFGGYLAERAGRLMLTYFFIELGIGAFGAASPTLLDTLGRHTAASSHVLSLFYMFAFLSVPTFLMGSTLPLLTKIFSGLSTDFLDTVGFLYFVNTIGAAAGALVASYVVISFFGLQAAVYFAAFINVAIAALIIVASRVSDAAAPQVSPPASAAVGDSPGLGRLVYPLVFTTGFLAVGYEIIWFRVLGVLAKDSPYAFSSVLAVYLVGIAVGSLKMKAYLLRHPTMDRRRLFFAIQVLIAFSVSATFVGYFLLTKYTPFELVTRASFAVDPHPNVRLLFEPGSTKVFALAIFSLFDVFLWSCAFVLVPTLFMGASFPLVSSLALTGPGEEGKTVGLVYFFMLAGNAAGGLVTGLVLLRILGTERSLALMCAFGFAFAVGLRPRAVAERSQRRRAAVGLLAVAVVAVGFPGKGELYKVMHHAPASGFDVYLEEGIDGVVVTYERGPAVQNYINGSAHGGRPVFAFVYETVEAMSRAPKLDKVLVIGYGTGTIVETLLRSDELRELVLVELNQTLLSNLRKMPLFAKMLADRRITVIVDDGRRFLLRTSETFDLIATDALRTTTSSSNNLYSADFFRLVKAHLGEGGVYLSWFDEAHVVPKTLASVFSDVEMHSYFCVSANGPIVTSQARRRAILDALPPADREATLSWSAYSGDRAYIESSTRGYPINRDWEPWTEYYLGLTARERFGMLRSSKGE